MDNQKGTLILTSTGLSAKAVCQAAEKYFSELPHKSVAIVTTAAEGKESNKYSKLAESQFKDVGFGFIEFIDLEDNPQADFSKYSVIYVCGGNTFKLLKHAREANFKNTIEKLLDRGGIYIGVSAGAIILAPTIKAAATIDPDPNIVGVSDFTGLSIINFEVHPHYELEEESEIFEYEKNVPYKIARLSNTQALIISGDNQKFIKPKIGKNIKKIRQDKRILQDNLSKLADLSLNTIVTVESGANQNPTIETLTKIAKALEVGVDDLIK